MVSGPVRSTKLPRHKKVTAGAAYKRRQRGVRLKYYPSSEVAERIELLRTHGHTYNSIAKLAGVSYHVVRRIHKGDYETTHPNTYHRIMSVPLNGDPGPDFWVPGFSTQRRIRALMCMGWRRKDIAERLSLGETHLSRLGANGSSVLCSIRTAVADLYEEWSNVNGGSRVTAARAKALGWYSPADWESANIDDPGSWPDSDSVDVVEDGRKRRAVELVSSGISVREAADKTGLSARTVNRALRELR